LRIRQSRPRFSGKGRLNVLERNFCSHLAVEMAAQPVGDDHEKRFGRARVADPVLIHGTAAAAGILRDGELHLNALSIVLSFCSIEAPPLCATARCSSKAFCSANTLWGRFMWSSSRHPSTMSSSEAEYFPDQ